MKESSGENLDINSNEGELSFEGQVELARVMCDAVDARNDFTEKNGGFDAIGDLGASMSFARQEYDRLAAAFEIARVEFDEKVSDKGTFVKKLEEVGEVKLAKYIRGMFLSQL